MQRLCDLRRSQLPRMVNPSHRVSPLATPFVATLKRSNSTPSVAQQPAQMSPLRAAETTSQNKTSGVLPVHETNLVADRAPGRVSLFACGIRCHPGGPELQCASDHRLLPQRPLRPCATRHASLRVMHTKIIAIYLQIFFEKKLPSNPSIGWNVWPRV